MRVGEVSRVRVATGGNARAALAAAAADAVERGSANVVEVAHDNGCPSLDGRGIGACTCELIVVTLERVR